MVTNLGDQAITDKNVLYFQISMNDRIWTYGMQVFHAADNSLSKEQLVWQMDRLKNIALSRVHVWDYLTWVKLSY